MAKKAATPKSSTPTKRAPRPKASSAPRRKAAPKKATRAATPRPSTPAAPTRRAIFIDVENTSSEADLLKIIEQLAIDRQAQPTQLFALGNWRAVGARVGRMLAGFGAHLMHSAPAPGVRDWSDLWIAVAAGRWLATAAPGDVMEIVSGDRAFDAVGDAATASGVVFRRISYRNVPGAAERPSVAQPAPHRSRRGGRGRRRRSPLPSTASHVTQAAAASPPSPAPVARAPRPVSDEEAHAASHEQIRAVLARLTSGGSRSIGLDALANALKGEGFVRPPGSPRLVVRLRRMKDVQVSPSGMVRLVGEPASVHADAPAETASEEAAAPVAAARRRPQHRGGRRRRRSPASGTAAPTASDAAS